MQSHIWWAILLVSSSLHFSLCLYTHLADPLHLLRCDIPALCSHLLLLLLLLFLPPSFHLTLPPSISHSSPYHSICLPVSPACPPHHPPHVSDKRPRCCQGDRSHCVPVARWLVAVAMIKNSEAALPLLLPSINKSSPPPTLLSPLRPRPSLPPVDTGRRKAQRPLRGTEQQWRDGVDDGLFVFISSVSLSLSLPLSFLSSCSQLHSSFPFIHLVSGCPARPV